MKKLIKLGLLSAALLATVAANASEKLSVKVASKASKMLSISLTEVAKDEIIYIKDFNGEILFSEKLEKSANYTKVFSFSTLPAGLYFVESNASDKIQSTPVVVDNKSVTLVDKSAKTYTAPVITLNENVMKVLVRNYNNAPVSISVYDQLGTLLSKSEDNTNTLVFGHYDTAKLASEVVIISVTEGDYNFIKEIKL